MKDSILGFSMARIVSIFFSFFLFANLFGQDFEQGYPREVPSYEGEVISPGTIDETIPPGVDENKVLVKELKGLLFVSDPHTFMDKILEGIDGVEIDDLYVPNEKAFRKKMHSFLSKPITFALLRQIKKAVSDYYSENYYPLVGVSIPTEQDISDGRIILLVVVAKLGQTKVEHARYHHQGPLLKEIRTKKGELIRSDRMLEDLVWINAKSPFRRVNLIYQKGEKVGFTDAILDVDDRYFIRPYTGYENRGYNIAGDSRYYVGVNMGNLFNADHQLNYQFMTADNPDTWWGMSGNYIIPFPWRASFTGLGSFIQSKSSVGEDVLSRGKAYQIGGRYTLYLKPDGQFRHKLEFGYDFKRTNNFLDFGIQGVSSSFIDISQFFIGYEAKYDDPSGETTFGSTLYLSPGGMTPFNKEKYFEQERNGAKPNYIYQTFQIERHTHLPREVTWVLLSRGQWATGPLIPTEAFAIGGYATVRGYDEDEVIGDNGVMICNEFRAPAFSLLKAFKKTGKLQFLIFVDYGIAFDLDPHLVKRNHQFLASTGPGLRYDFDTYLSVRFDWAIQLNRIPSLNDHHTRFHIGVLLAY